MTLFFLRSCVAVIYGVMAFNAVINYLAWQMGTWQLYMGLLLLMSVANCALVSIVHMIVEEYIVITHTKPPPPIVGVYCVEEEKPVY